MNEFLVAIEPALMDFCVVVFGAILGAIGVVGVVLIKRMKDYVIVQIGQANFDRAFDFARGIYYLLEDKYADVFKAGAQKKEDMQSEILKLIPSLTQAELDSINKMVCEEVKQAAIETGLVPTTTTTTTVVVDGVESTTKTIEKTQETIISEKQSSVEILPTEIQVN